MNRNIAISTDVFAAIWAQRQNGEESEDTILRRILDCKPVKTSGAATSSSQGEIGFVDGRNNVQFRRGFEIFRTYKRKEYRAIAEGGHWRRTDTNQFYDSLNQLNTSIATGNENVWNGNWKFKADDGSIKSIAALRA